MTNARRLKDSDKSDIAKFLNRILGLKVKLQNHLFDYFTDTMDANIEDAKRAGGYDLGITGKEFQCFFQSKLSKRSRNMHLTLCYAIENKC